MRCRAEVEQRGVTNEAELMEGGERAVEMKRGKESRCMMRADA